MRQLAQKLGELHSHLGAVREVEGFWRSESSSLTYPRALLLGGSWVVISRVITRVTILITLIRGLITYS